MPNNNPAIRKGERGEGIRLIQQGLIELGYPMPVSTKKYGSPDGIYGSETKAGVFKFQSDKGLGRDGSVGRNTMHKLDKLLPTTGKPLPAFELEGLTQSPAESFDELAGRAVLIEFFAYW